MTKRQYINPETKHTLTMSDLGEPYYEFEIKQVASVTFKDGWMEVELKPEYRPSQPVPAVVELEMKEKNDENRTTKRAC